MTARRLVLLSALALVGFAGNSLLCRAALREGGIDAASFTSLRLLSGAAMLWLVIGLDGLRRRGDVGRRAAQADALRPAPAPVPGDWASATALFGYALLFSLAYRSLGAATGALLLFGAVQATMLGQAWRLGKVLRGWRLAGVFVAAAGLLVLLLPGAHAPAPAPALAMAGAGVAWGIYSLRGRRGGPPLAATAGNFLRALPFAAIASLATGAAWHANALGLGCALASGALASGLGYALWYAALPSLRAATAATLQLAVPVITALGAVALLGEPLGPRLLLAAAAVLGGIALVIRAPG